MDAVGRQREFPAELGPSAHLGQASNYQGHPGVTLICEYPSGTGDPYTRFRGPTTRLCLENPKCWRAPSVRLPEYSA